MALDQLLIVFKLNLCFAAKDFLELEDLVHTPQKYFMQALYSKLC